MFSVRMKRLAGALTALGIIGSASVALADSPPGTDTLAPPSIAISNGTDSVVGGTGLHSGDGTIHINLPGPGKGTINQALLYWGKHTTPQLGTLGATDTITVDGQAVTGTRIGGPTLFFGATSFASYRADITSRVGHGGNNLHIEVPPRNENLDLFAYDGAGVLVIFTPKKLSPGGVQVRDGQDMAFFAFAPPLDTTVPQTFNFDSAAIERTAELNLLVGSVSSVTCNPARGTPRPNVINTTSGGTTTAWIDFLGSDVGCEFDALTFPVTIPAGTSSLVVQLLSACDDLSSCPSPNLPASMAWLATSARIPTVQVSGRMTGGGSIFTADTNATPRQTSLTSGSRRTLSNRQSTGQRITHGFQLRCDAADPRQNLEINWGGNRFHLEHLTSAVCTDDPALDPQNPQTDFDTYQGTGMGRYNGASGATAEWTFTDDGEPGVHDTMRILIRDAGGNVVLTGFAPLTFGNHQAH